jgi:Holliday junction resolvasome RuvABC endonuclease subunit
MENTGVAIFDLNTYQPIHITSISSPVDKKKKASEQYGQRLYVIANKLIELKNTYPPEIVAIERGFQQHNNSTQVIYRVHGLVNYLFYDIEQVYYPPKKVKEAIIRGDATKKLVQKIINNAYPNVKFSDEDQSDAFAVALCYLINKGKIEWDKKKLVK